MAAGMGSRYGGLKQLDPLGPHGETIMDYSIYDAMNAGFSKVVFVIRRTFDKQFREQVLSKYLPLIDTEVVYQEIDQLPAPFTPPAGREKPWGTNHAVMMAQSAVSGPFAIINADDFYGTDAFRTMANYLKSLPENSQAKYCMVAYPIENTLSDGGSVSRGVCSVNDQNQLTKIVEHKEISRAADGSILAAVDGSSCTISQGTLVSMNMWGFTPDYFERSQELFIEFLKTSGQELKSEFYIPTVVDTLINSKYATVQVLTTSSRWFGVTYAQDREQVVAALAKLTQEGAYPAPLLQPNK